MSSRLGELAIDGDRTTMTFRRHLPYPVERVWAALTDPLERKAWFGETVIDGRTGLSEQNARGFIPGTHAFFDRLEAWLDGTEIPDWSDRYAELAPSHPG
ncbi:hypothetical protein [Kribbella sindirgiensis]|uniref:ATPase n=1 Tax=Kribbella sindirgiensis TaxID=1124744 RepID=A0A4V2M3X8_9ACTN|nr:hypothetical protein [Kribbella sindirgiensis]TCC33752.1 hypothetical protein E0H50_17595 [Kribbella sindirgiensis]